MLKTFKKIHRARRSAVYALLATCVLIPAAGAQQASGDDAAARQSATAKPSITKSPSAQSGATKSSTSVIHHSRRKKSSRVRGQKKIDPERARTIQEALIREHYLSGEATGTWNQASEDAMRRFQGDHGWQTKEVPDSRALIALGLGPSKDHLLNPESAMTTGPQTPTASAPAANTPAPGPPAPTPNDSPSPQ